MENQEIILPQISIEEKTIAEDAYWKKVKITLDIPSDVDTVVNLTSEDITATNEDYQSVVETVVIPAGETAAYIILDIYLDYYNDPNETFLLKGTVISNNTNNSNIETIVTIGELNYDLPLLIVGDITANEGEDFRIPIALTMPSNNDIHVVLTTESVTAGIDDYAESVILVTIPSGETIIFVDFFSVDDNLQEDIETFNIIAVDSVVPTSISHGCITNYPFEDAVKGTVTIIDND